MAHDLCTVGPGFSHAAFGSQAVFRSALQALSHPGRCITLKQHDDLTAQGSAAAVFLLAVLDADCSLWLSPSLQGSPTAMWLRFHTGCQLMDHAAQAQFIWVGAGDLLPELQSLQQGNDEFPDQSATCLVDVRAMSVVAEESAGLSPQSWTLSGPGILDQASLSVTGLPADFVAQWAHNHACFPRGVDLLLTTQDQIVGLPRSTQICPSARA